MESGSPVAVQHVEQDYGPLLRERLSVANSAKNIPDAMESLNRCLAQDDAPGRLRDDRGAEIIHFPGRDKPPPRTFDPFKQLCTFDGVLIRVGGKKDDNRAGSSPSRHHHPHLQ